MTTLFLMISVYFTLNKFLFFLFVLSLVSNNTTSSNIGGRMHGQSPHLKLGDRPPVFPCLRPWVHVVNKGEPQIIRFQNPCPCPDGAYHSPAGNIRIKHCTA